MSEIEGLRIMDTAFVKARLPYIKDDGSRRGAEEQKASDPTTKAVRLLCGAKEALQLARLGSLKCCEARPGKGDTAILSVVDREGFDQLQDTIKTNTEKIAALEKAITELDSIAAPFLFVLSGLVSGAQSEVEYLQKRYSTVLGAGLQHWPNKGVEEVKKDPEIMQKAQMLEEAKAAEEKTVRELEPQIERIKSILAGVGC